MTSADQIPTSVNTTPFTDFDEYKLFPLTGARLLSIEKVNKASKIETPQGIQTRSKTAATARALEELAKSESRRREALPSVDPIPDSDNEPESAAPDNNSFGKFMRKFFKTPTVKEDPSSEDFESADEEATEPLPPVVPKREKVETTATPASSSNPFLYPQLPLNSTSPPSPSAPSAHLHSAGRSVLQQRERESQPSFQPLLYQFLEYTPQAPFSTGYEPPTPRHIQFSSRNLENPRASPPPYQADRFFFIYPSRTSILIS